VHKSNKLVFIHARRFADGGTGLALRTRLAFEALTGACASAEKHLICSSGDAEAALAKRMGWNYHRIETFDRTHTAGARAIVRLAAFAGSPVSQNMRSLLLTMLGGADLSTSAVAPLLQSIGKADVWLARSDLLHLASSVVPGSRVIVDSNDSVANLVGCYDPKSRVRKAAFRSLDAVVRDVQREELRLAGLCNRIIAISPEDRDYYSRSSCPSVILEESCVTTPAVMPPIAPGWDVGFIGGSHFGSISAAANFMRIARRSALDKLRFAIAGSVCERLDMTRPRNVEFVGRVSSASAFLASCRQVVFWSERETGTSVKFQEAVLSGTTVLANPSAARWSEAKPGRDYIECTSETSLDTHLQGRTTIAPSPLRTTCVREKVHERFRKLALD